MSAYAQAMSRAMDMDRDVRAVGKMDAWEIVLRQSIETITVYSAQCRASFEACQIL